MDNEHDQTAPHTRTFADAITRLGTDQTLTPGRRRDLVSALRSIARWLNLPLDATPANTDWIRQRLKQFHPKQAGISIKTFANVRSAALAALKAAGAGTKRRDWLPEMSPEWRLLFDAISDRQNQYKLSRLFRWCSGVGVEPDSLDDRAIERFADMLVEETLVKEPRKIARRAVHAWNRQRAEHSDWPQITLKPISSRTPWTTPLKSFPQSFQDDVDAWCARLGAEDLFDDDAPTQPCRPSTIRHKRFQIREMASALLRTGIPIENIRSLADLVEIDHFKQALSFMIERRESGPTEAICKVAATVKSIARWHVKVEESHLDRLRVICARLDRLSDKSRRTKRRRMEQFDDPLTLARLLLLPEKLVRTAHENRPKPRSAALRLQVAAAITLLFYAPMRIGNLASLDLKSHLRWSGRRHLRTLHISIPASEVKNGKPLHYSLTGQSLDIIDAYLEQGRPKLTSEPSSALFPKINGGPKAASDLSTLIRRTVFKEEGIEITPHLFRSLAARLHYLTNAGDIGTIAHVLGDRISTVQKAYASLEQKAALDRYHSSVLRSQKDAGRVAQAANVTVGNRS